MATPTSGLYSVAISAYIKAEARHRLAGLWWIPAVAALSLAIAGTFDSRYLYLCLMVVLIVYPMVLSLSWLAIAARPCMSILTRPQHIEQLPDGNIKVCFHAFPTDSDGEEQPSVVASIVLTPGVMAEAERLRNYLCVTPGPVNELSLPRVLIPLEIADELSNTYITTHG
ncbi:MAG: hypothetical protein NC418_02755 [Muribaculaceae bacterium]|nr:hypothetical protein [Muribaculaceae bacterium]